MSEKTTTTCSTCKSVTPNDGPWNVSATWCNTCVEAGKHLPEVATIETQADYTVDVNDIVTSDKRKNGVPAATFTGEEFVEFIVRTITKFPNATFQVGREFDGRLMTDGGFFLTIKRSEDSRGQTFRVKKGVLN